MKRKRPGQKQHKARKTFGDTRSAYHQDGSTLIYDEHSVTLIEARAAYRIGSPAEILAFKSLIKK